MCEENRQLYHLYCQRCGNIYLIDEAFPNFCPFCGIKQANTSLCDSCKHQNKYYKKEDYKLVYKCNLYPKCENYELWEKKDSFCDNCSHFYYDMLEQEYTCHCPPDKPCVNDIVNKDCLKKTENKEECLNG